MILANSTIQTGLTFNEEKHAYHWYGKRAPGVTTVLGHVGVKKYLPDGNPKWEPVGFDDRYLQDDTAAMFGTSFHKIAFIILRGGVPNFPDSMKPWVESFMRFRRENPFQALCDREGRLIIEYPLYSERYGYAGTPDLLATNGKGEVILYDWKTSVSFQEHYNRQTAAYEQLVKEVFQIKKKIIRKVVLFSEKGYKPITRQGISCASDWVNFQSVLNVYKIGL